MTIDKITNTASKISLWAEAVTKAARPFLTILVTVVYNFTLLVALYNKQMTIQEYMTAVGPVNAMVMGFWFGERAALKAPGEPL